MYVELFLLGPVVQRHERRADLRGGVVGLDVLGEFVDIAADRLAGPTPIACSPFASRFTRAAISLVRDARLAGDERVAVRHDGGRDLQEFGCVHLSPRLWCTT